MPKLSRISPDPRHMGIFIDNFWNAITLIEDKEEAKSFLKDLLTHTETKMFAKRIQIAKMLLQGYDYRAIRNHVKVTSGTIAQVNNLLHTRGDGLKQIVSRLLEIESKREKKLEGKSQSLVPAGPYRLIPDLIEFGAGVTKQKIKRIRKKKSVIVEPLDV